MIARKRFEHIVALPLDYITNAEFEQSYTNQTERSILSDFSSTEEPLLETGRYSDRKTALADMTNWLTRIGKTPLLTSEQETYLFKKFNFLKFNASKLRETLNKRSPKVAIMDEIERLYQEAIEVRNLIISSNLRLVVSIAKKYVQGTISLDDLISDGYISLMKAVEKFDYSRGNKFSTYASWAIYLNFARTIPNEHVYQHRFCASDVDLFEMHSDKRSCSKLDEQYRGEQLSRVNQFMEVLEPRERAIIQRRFGLGEITFPQTLRQVGKEMGVTKERVRQIETRVLNKLRKIAHENAINLPEYGL